VLTRAWIRMMRFWLWRVRVGPLAKEGGSPLSLQKDPSSLPYLDFSSVILISGFRPPEQ
jgi:hypothetical protein